MFLYTYPFSDFSSPLWPLILKSIAKVLLPLSFRHSKSNLCSFRLCLLDKSQKQPLLLSPLSRQPNAGKQRKSYRLEQMKSLRLADRNKVISNLCSSYNAER